MDIQCVYKLSSYYNYIVYSLFYYNRKFQILQMKKREGFVLEITHNKVIFQVIRLYLLLILYLTQKVHIFSVKHIIHVGFYFTKRKCFVDFNKVFPNYYSETARRLQPPRAMGLNFGLSPCFLIINLSSNVVFLMRLFFQAHPN